MLPCLAVDELQIDPVESNDELGEEEVVYPANQMLSVMAGAIADADYVIQVFLQLGYKPNMSENILGRL